MVITEIVLSPEMLAAGVEAMKEARTRCLEDGDVVTEIYLAMYGAFIRYQYEQESIH